MLVQRMKKFRTLVIIMEAIPWQNSGPTLVLRRCPSQTVPPSAVGRTQPESHQCHPPTGKTSCSENKAASS